MSNDQETRSTALTTVGNVPLGSLVVALYVVSVLSVFLGFAAYITRTEWETAIATNGTQVQDLDNLIFLVQREEDLEGKIVAEQDSVRQIDANIDAAHDLVAKLTAEIGLSKSRLEDGSELVLAHLETSKKIVISAHHAKIDRVLNNNDAAVQARARDAVVLAGSLGFAAEVDAAKVTDFQELMTSTASDLAAERKQHELLSNDLRVANSTRDRHLEARSPPLKRIAGLNEKLDALRETLPLTSSERAQIGALSIMWGGQAFLDLVGMPTIFLTLIVTIAAGGLGTVVSFSRSYRVQDQGEAIKASRLFVALGEGIAAAIAIFLLSGAGMLVLTQGAGPQNEVQLSPYMVAFVAFLSGFMAEDAFTRIRAAGQSFFKVEGQDDKGNGKAAANSTGVG